MPFIVKKTLVDIIESGNDYLVKVKGNQPGLFGAVKQIAESKKEIGRFVQKENNRGRKETRTIKTYTVTPWISDQWCQAKTIVYVERKRQTPQEVIITQSYYLSSLAIKAIDFSQGVRHHWGIENRLHYVKDVTFEEDKSKIKQGQAPAVFSLLRNLALNVARIQGENRIKRFMRRCAGNIDLIYSYLE
jgi:predicted transposase YbfD/YdcC